MPDGGELGRRAQTIAMLGCGAGPSDIPGQASMHRTWHGSLQTQVTMVTWDRGACSQPGVVAHDMACEDAVRLAAKCAVGVERVQDPFMQVDMKSAWGENISPGECLCINLMEGGSCRIIGSGEKLEIWLPAQLGFMLFPIRSAPCVPLLRGTRSTLLFSVMEPTLHGFADGFRRPVSRGVLRTAASAEPKLARGVMTRPVTTPLMTTVGCPINPSASANGSSRAWGTLPPTLTA